MKDELDDKYNKLITCFLAVIDERNELKERVKELELELKNRNALLMRTNQELRDALGRGKRR